MQKVGGSLLGRLANMEMWPQPENIILQISSHFHFFQINTHNYYNVSMFDKLVLFFTITQRKSAKDDFGMSPKQKEVSGVLVKLTTTQYVLIIIIHFYKGSKSGIRKYEKIENTAKCAEEGEG